MENKEAFAASFGIRRMEDIHLHTGGKPGSPHRHDYYTVIWIQQGVGQHIIDFQTFTLSDHQVYFISPGQVHLLLPDKKPAGWVITFSPEFLIRNNIRDCFISDINLFRDYADSPPLILDKKTQSRLSSLAQDMEEMLSENSQFRYEALGSLLRLFLIYCNNICDIHREENTQTTQAGLTILRSFKNLVETHFKEQHKVNFYADQLMVSPDHLNKTVKALIGKSAKTYIQNRIIAEAKRVLVFSEKTGKELAFELGFEEPSHFSAFFKKITGVPLSQFRSTPNPGF
ncbi:MAG: helix-turn-helix transcriptional regulator [Bacteroidia bacterium]